MSLSDFDLIKISLTELFSFCVNLWTELVNATHTAGFYIGCVAIFFAVKYLIIPIVGSFSIGGSSDMAHKTADEKEHDRHLSYIKSRGRAAQARRKYESKGK